MRHIVQGGQHVEDAVWAVNVMIGVKPDLRQALPQQEDDLADRLPPPCCVDGHRQAANRMLARSIQDDMDCVSTWFEPEQEAMAGAGANNAQVTT